MALWTLVHAKSDRPFLPNCFANIFCFMFTVITIFSIAFHGCICSIHYPQKRLLTYQHFHPLVVFHVVRRTKPSDLKRFCVVVMVRVYLLISTHFTRLAHQYFLSYCPSCQLSCFLFFWVSFCRVFLIVVPVYFAVCAVIFSVILAYFFFVFLSILSVVSVIFFICLVVSSRRHVVVLVFVIPG